MKSEFDILQEAAAGLQDRFDEAPLVAAVLGSGLSGLAAALEDPTSVRYADVKDWIPPSVDGHAGELLVGRIGRTRCAMLSGRSHLYEGYTATEVVRHVRTLRLWGVRILVLTNAAGGLFRGTQPGELMIITDHLNLTGQNPFVGPYDSRLSVARFKDSSDSWDPQLTDVLRRAFVTCNIPKREGVYAGMLGPDYETPAEVDMLDALGANAAGMSSVLECRAFCGMPDLNGHTGRVCGVTMLSNAAAGRGRPGVILTHQDIIEACGIAGPKLTQVMVTAIPHLPACLS